MQILVDEHRVIERVLTALATWGEAVRRGGPVDPERLAAFVDFLRGYADAIHHGKEEKLVFRALLQHGAPPAIAAQLAAIQRDHESARLLIGDLSAAAKHAGAWSPTERDALARTAQSYVSLLRRHIRDEDTVVFPATWTAMPESLRQPVADACATFDAAHAAQAAQLRDLADTLARAYEG